MYLVYLVLHSLGMEVQCDPTDGATVWSWTKLLTHEHINDEDTAHFFVLIFANIVVIWLET